MLAIASHKPAAQNLHQHARYAPQFLNWPFVLSHEGIESPKPDQLYIG